MTIWRLLRSSLLSAVLCAPAASMATVQSVAAASATPVGCEVVGEFSLQYTRDERPDGLDPQPGAILIVNEGTGPITGPITLETSVPALVKAVFVGGDRLELRGPARRFEVEDGKFLFWLDGETRAVTVTVQREDCVRTLDLRRRDAMLDLALRNGPDCSGRPDAYIDGWAYQDLLGGLDLAAGKVFAKRRPFDLMGPPVFRLAAYGNHRVTLFRAPFILTTPETATAPAAYTLHATIDCSSVPYRALPYTRAPPDTDAVGPAANSTRPSDPVTLITVLLAVLLAALVAAGMTRRRTAGGRDRDEQAT